MGLLRGLLLLPVAGPLRGTFWLADRIRDAALAEHHDPAAIKAALVELEQRLDAGEIDEETYETAEAELLDRLEAAMREEARP